MSIVLRPYQRQPVARALRAGKGLIIAPTGAGKTEMGLEVLRRAARELLRRPDAVSVVLVHTRDLRDQWVARAKQRGLRAASWSPKRPLRPGINVATVQSLDLQPWPAHLRADLLLVDEAHHAAAPTWGTAIRSLRAPHVWGLTATLEREDGRESEVVRVIGPIVARVQAAEVERVGAVLQPHVRVVRTGWSPRTSDVAEERMASRSRNGLVLRDCVAMVRRGRRPLVIVDRVDHATALAATLRRAGLRAESLVGPATTTERRRVLEGVRRGRVQVLVATSIVDEGLDAPVLDTALLVGPSAVRPRTQQRIGRVLRPGTAKRPALVLDYVDADARSARAFERRSSLYAARGWTVEEAGLRAPRPTTRRRSRRAARSSSCACRR